MGAMGRWVAAALLLLAPACKAELSDNLASSDANSQPDDSGMNVLADSGIDAPVVLGAWGVPTAIPGASSALGESRSVLKRICASLGRH